MSIPSTPWWRTGDYREGPGILRTASPRRVARVPFITEQVVSQQNDLNFLDRAFSKKVGLLVTFNFSSASRSGSLEAFDSSGDRARFRFVRHSSSARDRILSLAVSKPPTTDSISPIIHHRHRLRDRIGPRSLAETTSP